MYDDLDVAPADGEDAGERHQQPASSALEVSAAHSERKREGGGHSEGTVAVDGGRKNPGEGAKTERKGGKLDTLERGERARGDKQAREALATTQSPEAEEGEAD
eukprot:495943-Pyramimonas_sp.AAC.1